LSERTKKMIWTVDVEASKQCNVWTSKDIKTVRNILKSKSRCPP